MFGKTVVVKAKPAKTVVITGEGSTHAQSQVGCLAYVTDVCRM